MMLVSCHIILGDTLLDRFAEDEIEVVMAHERAHYKNRDIARTSAWGAASTVASHFQSATVGRAFELPGKGVGNRRQRQA